MERLEEKVAVITGASSGFGREMSITFAREGAKIVCADINREPNPDGYEEKKEPTDQEIVSAGGQAVFVKCNITQQDEVTNLIQTAVSTFGRLDIMMCNAGVYRAGMLTHEMPVEFLDDCLNVNVRGTWFCCQEAIKQFLAQKTRGKIIVTCSSSAINPYPVQAPYSMSKAAIGMLAQTLALEYGAAGINTNAICPTGCKTALTSNGYNDENFRRIQTSKIPLGRWGEPKDVANLALFLASDEADYMNGAMVLLDGGETLSGTRISDFGIAFE
ncbi:MAG: glucose 1-dehydrogenase [Synergistaceae bacterium]|jgi:NAD(P)-dependent dehydrogenase (short-subunit alcohol dehydrogenase family)|nr:glucose 1-dehydrogenase [Synergistaceae bacterium]